MSSIIGIFQNLKEKIVIFSEITINVPRRCYRHFGLINKKRSKALLYSAMLLEYVERGWDPKDLISLTMCLSLHRKKLMSKAGPF